MAVEFKVAHTRTSEYLILPEDITVKPELNGRHELPDIEWMIDSFIQVGQLQPVVVSAEDGKAVLRAGFSRWRSAIEINRQKLTPAPFKLRCVYLRADDAKGFIAGIHENIVRNPVQPLDDAHNIAKMETWNMTHEEIAKLYRQDVKWVESRVALLDLVPEAAQAVVDGRMKLPAAAHFAKLNKDVQRKRIKAKGDGKFTAKDAKADPAPDAPVTPKRENRLACIRAILETAVNNGTYPAGILAGTDTETFCAYLLDVLNGESASSAVA